MQASRKEGFYNSKVKSSSWFYITITFSRLTSSILVRERSDDNSHPKIHTKQYGTLWMLLFLTNHSWIPCVPNATILLIDQIKKIWMCLIDENDFILKSQHTSCCSIIYSTKPTNRLQLWDHWIFLAEDLSWVLSIKIHDLLHQYNSCGGNQSFKSTRSPPTSIYIKSGSIPAEIW